MFRLAYVFFFGKLFVINGLINKSTNVLFSEFAKEMIYQWFRTLIHSIDFSNIISREIFSLTNHIWEIRNIWINGCSVTIYKSGRSMSNGLWIIIYASYEFSKLTHNAWQIHNHIQHLQWRLEKMDICWNYRDTLKIIKIIQNK